jgi:hypothetical protein
MSLDSLLDATLDDLADIPSIQIFPAGAHKVTVGFKIDDKKAAVQVSFTYVEALELSDPTAVAPEAGAKNGLYIGLKKKDGTANEYGQGTLKMIASALKENFPGNSTREILEAAEGAEIAIVTKIRYGKGEYEGKDNLDLVKMEVI